MSRLEFAKNRLEEYGEEFFVCESSYIDDCVTLGANIYIGHNCSIGLRGFGYERDEDLTPINIPHTGKVIIGDNVSIGSNTCIDRGTISDTIIGNNTKIDNLCHIAHNVIIGNNVLIVAGAILCGSCIIEDNVWIGPGAIISNKITIGEGSYISLGSVVTKNVEPGSKVTGNFAIDHDKFIQDLKNKDR